MTTLMFDVPENGLDSHHIFIVQVIGIDEDGYCKFSMRQRGKVFRNLEKAKEYALQANNNGFDCKIHLLRPHA